MSDPTIDFLSSLNDESKYVVRRNVCIFKPHRRRTKNGGEIVVTRDTLPEVVSAVDRLRRDHGVVIPFGPGHRKSGDADETSQPPIWGFQVNPRVGTAGPKGEPCVLVDEHVRKPYAGEAAEYPFRSPEYYPQTREIRWTALLKRDPFLDMGMSVFYGTDEAVVSYQAEAVAADEPPNGEPTMSIVATPPPAVTKEDYESLRMQLDQQSVSYARIEADNKRISDENQSLRDSVSGLQKQLDRNECEKLVIQLEAEGYQLEDRASEIEDLVDLITEPKRQKRAAWIRKHCRKGDPTTRPVPYSKDGMVPVADDVPGQGAADGAMDDATARKVTQYQREHGGSWDVAKKAVTGK